LLAPVRVFRIKGVELSIELLAAAKAQCRRRGLPVPYLLVFGSLQEDREYAREVVACAHRLGVVGDVVFLGGVPLGSYPDARGNWRLDEVDLLRLAASRSGVVLFTPNVTDVETIGLGPALASCAGLPAVVTRYDAFDRIYGPDFRCLFTDGRPDSTVDTAVQLVRAIYDPPARAAAGGGTANRAVLRRVFPSDGWRDLLHELAGAGYVSTAAPAAGRGTPGRC
jgi:glycosyltransferase involved in cell wall biosynthesis